MLGGKPATPCVAQSYKLQQSMENSRANCSAQVCSPSSRENHLQLRRTLRAVWANRCANHELQQTTVNCQCRVHDAKNAHRFQLAGRPLSAGEWCVGWTMQHWSADIAATKTMPDTDKRPYDANRVTDGRWNAPFWNSENSYIQH